MSKREITVEHKCNGPNCLTCAMARGGYVRSFAGFWWMPNHPGWPTLTDEEAEATLQPTLFEQEVG